VKNNRVLDKRILAIAVTTAMFGAGAAQAYTTLNIGWQLGNTVATERVTLDNASASNATSNYYIGHNGTLQIGNNMTSIYGTIDGSDAYRTTNGTLVVDGDDHFGNVTIEGSTLTLYGNVGATNATGNFTLEAGTTLYLADNMTTFRTSNLTIGTNSKLYTGNNASQGYNRGDSGTTNALTLTSNITMRDGSILYVGNSTTITGSISGETAGQGTLNLVGNFTTGGNIGVSTLGGKSANTLAEIAISSNNTLFLEHQMGATNIYVNGTLTSMGGNVTSGTTYLNEDGVLNLFTPAETLSAGGNSKLVWQAIEGLNGRNGTVNINGTFATEGVIGGNNNGLDAINIDAMNNADTNPGADIGGSWVFQTAGHIDGITVTFAHSVNATTINLGQSNSQNNNTLTVTKSDDGANIVIAGNIAGSGNYTSGGNDVRGILNIDTDTDVTGTTGTSGAYLSETTVATGVILTAQGSIYSGNITLEQTSSATGTNATLALNGTSGSSYNVKGGINGGSSNTGEGLVDINSGNWTFDSEIGTTNLISAMRIEDAAWANFSKDISANETLYVNGTINISGSLSITALDANGNGSGFELSGTLSQSTNATLQISDDAILTLGRKTEAGVNEGDGANFVNATIRLKGAGTTSYNSNSTAAINIGANNQTITLNQVTIDMFGNNNNTYSDGQVVNIIGRGSDLMNNGTLKVTGSVSVLDSSAMLSFSENSANFVTGSGTNNQTGDSALQVTVNYASASTLGLTGNTKATYDGAKTAISMDSAIFDALASMATNALVDSAVATLHPATGGSAAASAAISGSSIGTANTRMAYVRQTGLGRGMNAGGGAQDESMWLQIFGANIDQDTVSGISGYDANGQGLALGIDGLSADGTTRIGIAGSFANTDVDGKDSTTKTTEDIDTTQVMVYATKEYTDGMYLQGVASYSFNANTGTRRILVGAVDRTASSSYDSGLFSIDVEAGWPKEDGGITITPTIGLNISSLSTDAYTETGAGNMNLKVTPTDVNTVEGKIGAKITGKSVDADGGIGRPEIRVGVSHNFGDGTADSTSTFTSGGSSFTTKGVDTDSTKVDVGLGYTYTTPEGDTEISVNADGRHSSSYLQFGGGLTVKWKF